MTTMIDLAVADIRPSPYNHRKKFDKLDELGKSLVEKGCINPITVRRKADPKHDEAHELVAGERRWRAAKLVKLPTLPAIIRELSDKEVLEIQLVENVQREDVHPLEEADGYRELMEKHKYTVEQIVEKTGKSKAAVYARLKLCELAPVPRKAFLEDKLTPSVALMIARIPDAKLQAQATNEVLGGGDYNDYDDDITPREIQIEEHEVLAGDKPKKSYGKLRETLTLSVREAQLHLQRKYMLRLEQAPFDITDATLTKAGACTPCPKRTGNQRELFADVKSADVCTDPACFDSKKKADWDRKASQATRAGHAVLDEKQSAKVFDSWNNTIHYGSDFVELKDKVPTELDPSGKKTWESLLGKEAVVPKTFAQDTTGAARELVKKSDAIAVLKKSGKLKEAKAEAAAKKKAPDKYQLEQARKAKEAKRRHVVARLAFAEIEKKGRDAAGTKFWQWLALAVLQMIDEEDRRNLCKRRDLDVPLGSGKAERELAKIIKEKKTVDDLLGVIVEIASSYHAVGGIWAGKNFGENFTGACEVLGVDLKKLTADVVKAENAKAKKPAAAAPKKGKAKR